MTAVEDSDDEVQKMFLLAMGLNGGQILSTGPCIMLVIHKDNIKIDNRSIQYFSMKRLISFEANNFK